VVVAIVKEVDDKGATYGNPPRVKLEIGEVLRGDPKAERTHAVFAPPDHGIDTGVIEENPRYKEWARTPMQGLKVGEKLILWGTSVLADNKSLFYVGANSAFSDEKRQAAIQQVKRDEDSLLKYKKELEAEKQKHLEDVKKWRQGVSADDIRKYAAVAEFVGVGRLPGGSFGLGEEVVACFEIQSILKGKQEKLFTINSYFVVFRMSRKLFDLLDRETDYVVFLKSTGTSLSASAASYERIPLGDGVVIADEQVTKSLSELHGMRPESTTSPATSLPAR
jgi:hypothetical protein